MSLSGRCANSWHQRVCSYDLEIGRLPNLSILLHGYAWPGSKTMYVIRASPIKRYKGLVSQRDGSIGVELARIPIWLSEVADPFLGVHHNSFRFIHLFNEFQDGHPNLFVISTARTEPRGLKDKNATTNPFPGFRDNPGQCRCPLHIIKGPTLSSPSLIQTAPHSI